MHPIHETVRFEDTELSVIDRDGVPWLTGTQIAYALGTERRSAVTDIHARHRDEFTDAMTAVIRQGRARVRIFSPRGAHLIAMFARTPRAKAFRRWVLDVLEATTARAPEPPALPAPPTRVRILIVAESGKPTEQYVLDEDVAILATRDVDRLRRDCLELAARLRVLWGTESASRLDEPL